MVRQLVSCMGTAAQESRNWGPWGRRSELTVEVGRVAEPGAVRNEAVCGPGVDLVRLRGEEESARGQEGNVEKREERLPHAEEDLR